MGATAKFKIGSNFSALRQERTAANCERLGMDMRHAARVRNNGPDMPVFLGPCGRRILTGIVARCR